MSRYLAAADVGGTFTDIAVWDAEREIVLVNKLLSTPDDPAKAVLEGIRGLDVDPWAVVHATTLVTNALIERTGCPVGMLTTAGYRDVVETATELRYDPFDLHLTRPEPLAPRRHRLPVEGRLAAAGNEVRPLDEAAVREAGRKFTSDGIKAVAVCFFNSYRNGTHEQRAAAILRDEFPSLAVCCSAEVAPEIREYPRFTTALANAYVQPIAEGYLRKLEQLLGVSLFVMLSDGGITTARVAASAPVQIVESGPAAGAMAAAHIAQASRAENVIAFDMGGTTAKISLIRQGVPERGHELEVGRVHRFKKGSGLPVRIPVVELIEIGAGGGSMAAKDDLGLLRVGPRSAGASPGPACYGLGGDAATVTDADVFLGYLNPNRFLGGRMQLDVEANRAVITRLAEELSVSPNEAAAGIADVVNNGMATAARIHIAEHGQDPRRFRLTAFGGAGPVHAYGLARMLHVREVVFPRGAGIASAIGLLVAPRSIEHTRTLVCPLDQPDWAAIEATLNELRQRGAAIMKDAGVATSEIRYETSADMRFAGQGYEINVPIPEHVVSGRDEKALMEVFRSEYRRRFDRELSNMAAEVISWRVRASGGPAVRSYELAAPDSASSETLPRRPAYFKESGGFVDTAVYDRLALSEGTLIRGPALIEEVESTVVVGPRAQVRVDAGGDLVMTIDD